MGAPARSRELDKQVGRDEPNMIKRLRIRGYKSLKDVELTDLSRLVVLFGPNAAGKSNLLDAFDLLAHLATEDTLVGAFQKHRGNRLERSSPVRWFFHQLGRDQEKMEMSFELDLELSKKRMETLNSELAEREKIDKLERAYTRVTRRRLRYELTLRYLMEARALQVVHESLLAIKANGTPFAQDKPYIRHQKAERRASVKLERQAHPRYFDIPRNRTLLSEISDLVNHPHLVAASREIGSYRIYYVEPTRMRGTVSDIEATDPGRHGEYLASFYHWLGRSRPKKFRNLIHNLQRFVPQLEEVDVREEVEGFLQLWVQEDAGQELPAALVSEGTLRLLCLLGIATTPEPPSVVGYEEPENGVNPARLSEMLRIIRNASEGPDGTQYFLTTHSPGVVDFFSDDADLIKCERYEDRSTYVRSEELPLFKHVEMESVLGAEKLTLG